MRTHLLTRGLAADLSNGQNGVMQVRQVTMAATQVGCVNVCVSVKLVHIRGDTTRVGPRRPGAYLSYLPFVSTKLSKTSSSALADSTHSNSKLLAL